MSEEKDLEKRITALEERNRRVGKDKDWELSYTRRGLLILFTYLAIGIYLNVIDIPNPWLNAIVPSLAFWLSTLSLPYIRKFWEKYLHKT